MASLSMHHPQASHSPQRPFDILPTAPADRPARCATVPSTARGWSIDDEPMGTGWHDSSWMLRKGLLVVEGAPALAAMPVEWQLAWL